MRSFGREALSLKTRIPVASMTDPAHSEQRKATRKAANWRVLFGPMDQLSPGFLADLSPIGVSILTEKQLALGLEIEVHFGVEEDDTRGKLQMRAVVRHCGAGRLGVQFINVDAGQREHWWKIMRGSY